MDDLISRQAAIDALDEQYWNLLGILDIPICKEIRNAAKDTIKALPSAQPERKKGEWLPDFEYDGEDEYCFKECSLCKYRSEEYFNFCPNCGAKMEES